MRERNAPIVCDLSADIFCNSGANAIQISLIKFSLSPLAWWANSLDLYSKYFTMVSYKFLRRKYKEFIKTVNINSNLWDNINFDESMKFY